MYTVLFRSQKRGCLGRSELTYGQACKPNCISLLQNPKRHWSYQETCNSIPPRKRLVHAVISSRLDNCNSLFVNINKDHLQKLQKVQNAAAKLILGWRRRDSATAALKKLHWLNIDARITFKILLLVYKVVNGLCSENIQLRYKGFNGRTEDYLKLHTPNFKTAYGWRIFEYNGSKLWNELPVDVRMEESIEVYKKKIKTILFDGNTEFKRRAFKYN